MIFVFKQLDIILDNGILFLGVFIVLFLCLLPLNWLEFCNLINALVILIAACNFDYK